MKILQNQELKTQLWEKCGISKQFTENPLERMEVVEFSKGDYLFKEGEYSPYLYLFVKGKLKAFTLSTHGKMVVYGYFTNPRTFGEVNAFETCTPQISVQAMEESHCLSIYLPDHGDFFFQDVKFLQYLCRLLGREVVDLDHRLANVIAATTENRLASHLLDSMVEEGRLDFHLNETAELIVTSYRHLLRVLEDFCAQGILRKERQKYFVKDMDKLKELASELHKVDASSSL